jgi:hypothetical protein
MLAVKFTDTERRVCLCLQAEGNPKSSATQLSPHLPRYVFGEFRFHWQTIVWFIIIDSGPLLSESPCRISFKWRANSSSVEITGPDARLFSTVSLTWREQYIPYQARTHIFSLAFYFRLLLADLTVANTGVYLSSTTRRPGKWNVEWPKRYDPLPRISCQDFWGAWSPPESLFPEERVQPFFLGRGSGGKSVYLRICRLWPFLLTSLGYLG